MGDAAVREAAGEAEMFVAGETWRSVCRVEELVPDTGVCALVDGEQVAIFHESRSRGIYAISNYDPIGEANILSRGIIGSIGADIVVASPLYKQHFNLQTGLCLEQTGYRVKTYPVRVLAGEVQIQTAL